MEGRHLFKTTVYIDDFRGVSTNPVISKVFEHCILDRYRAFLNLVPTNLALKHRLCERDVCTTNSSRLLCVILHYS